MIAAAELADWWFCAFLMVVMVLVLATCVCNPKSKRFNKHKSFILSHELPNEVPPISSDLAIPSTSHAQHANALPAQSFDIDSCNKLKTNAPHRALPDIPQVAGISGPAETPFSNSTSFGDVISNDDVDSLYTVTVHGTVNAMASSHSHPYARIRSNHLVDSSENDTDDYSESRVPAAVVVSAAAHEPPNDDTYELEPTAPHGAHILRLQLRNNDDPSPPPLFNSDADLEANKEISYGNISVRESLSKVLAERENIEHHYNEVEEEERVSSFYEEITSGSATYSKINDIGHVDQPTFGEPTPSTSHHLHNNIDNARLVNSNLQSSNVALETSGPVYSFVDKKMKRANLHQAPNRNVPQPDSNNLYTKVVKSPANGPKVIDPPRYSPPPPLPPLLHRDAQPKLYRNTIMFGTPSSSATAILHHNHNQHLHYSQHHQPQNNFNALADELEQQQLQQSQNIYHKISRADSEKDPGYETVDRNEPVLSLSNQTDYVYEAIMTNDLMDESDPAYEIVKPGSDRASDDNPAYETIKNEPYTREDQHDPNYEIIPSTSARITLVNLVQGTPSVTAHQHTLADMQATPATAVNSINHCALDENCTIIEHL